MNLDLTSYTFPTGYTCLKSKQEVFDDIRDYVKAMFLDDNAISVVGDTLPSVDDQNKVWIRVDSIGWPIDILTYTSTGWKGLSHREVGNIFLWAGSSLPNPQTEWAWCDGRTLSQTEYSDLYSVIGSTFNNGSEGVDEFSIPDTRGRVVIGTGSGGGLTPRVIADLLGEEEHILITAELPAHQHAISIWAVSNDAPDTCGSGGDLSGGDCGFYTNTITEGGGASHNNMQPSLAIANIIRIKAL